MKNRRALAGARRLIGNQAGALFLRGQRCPQVVTVHLADEVRRNLYRASCLALVVVGAGTEAFGVHLLDHGQSALHALGLALRQVRQLTDLGRHQQRGEILGGFARP